MHPTQRATQVLQALQQRWLAGVPDVEIPKPPQAVSLVGHHGYKGLDWIQSLPSVLVADHTSMMFRTSAHMLYIAVEVLKKIGHAHSKTHWSKPTTRVGMASMLTAWQPPPYDCT